MPVFKSPSMNTGIMLVSGMFIADFGVPAAAVAVTEAYCDYFTVFLELFRKKIL